jgi:hypothetical protein
VIFDDAAGVLLRGFAGILGGDGVKNFLFDQMLGRSAHGHETDADAQKDFHRDEGKAANSN